MAVEWSGLTPEIMLQLDRGSRGTLGAQLQGALRTAIRSGRLRADERLPSSRKLASDLGVSRGLVQSTYEQLAAEGYLTATAGGTTRVAPAVRQSAIERTAVGLPVDVGIAFTPGRPDLNSFPMRDWLWACGEAARIASRRDIGYGEAAGSSRLREVLAAYAQRVRAASIGSRDVIVCSGFTQGVALTLRVLREQGAETVAVEDPGHGELTMHVRRAGLQAVPVPVDADGLIVDELRSTSATAVILTPAHQTPTGVVLGPGRRQELLRWADERDGIMIEDDYDSEFRYDRQPVGALQGLAPDRVVMIGSVSKSLGPGLRLAWILAPSRLAAAIAEEKHHSDLGSPSLDQLALARLLESGRYDAHLRRMRRAYAAKRVALTEALQQHAPHLRLTGLDAGFHAVAELPPGTDEAAIIRAAARRSVHLHGMQRYRVLGADDRPAIVFGFGDLNEHAIRSGIARIANLLQPAVDVGDA
ncbi:GntR family transcriptional regulator/MocR family aminotransferase [Kribbella sp. VKM Ac-2527]|uniref:GntR family transcriptional regulator/MocR family aminotransferase n=1 Tax=Kribbella caucasensis TaxID=2512215 RepID=A0A4R6KNX8_9ACTN|nr:PLP-dependent aminotransferase family protein [Kribbella sp. VKM Ac-2527]TDO52726.1 GntR family transcriptional regulator/MocR family aminotransferase [Kribbella sp. VKM Ac-2527]